MKYQGKNLKTVTTLPNNEDVDGFEKYLEMKLPDDYKQFLITCNGGKPEDCMGFDVVVRSFFGITEDYNYSLKHHLNIYTQANRMPKIFYPLAMIMVVTAYVFPSQKMIMVTSISGATMVRQVVMKI
jgi:hypothetical protein